MEFLHRLWELIRHLDPQHMQAFIQYCGPWFEAVLFGIVFCETGLVVTPFLPGDSLLFVAGTVAALPDTANVWYLMLLLIVAAILGDTVNYHIGKYIGPRALSKDRWFLKREHLDRTHRFFEKYGGKTIILARFVPIVRTFAPFVAGVGAMSYGKFLLFNVVGAILWVVLLTMAGYFFGNLDFVQKNYELVVLAIVFISVLPMIYEFVRAKVIKKAQAGPGAAAGAGRVETPARED